MSTMSKLVPKPASCESQRISYTYYDSEVQCVTKEIVRSFTKKPEDHKQEDQNNDTINEHVEESKEIPVMNIKKSKQILKSVPVKKSRDFQ